MTTAAGAPIPVTANVSENLTAPNGPWVVAVIANLTAMPVLIDSATWLPPYCAELFTFPFAKGYYAVQAIAQGTTTTGHLLVTWYDPDDAPPSKSYPLLIPLTVSE